MGISNTKKALASNHILPLSMLLAQKVGTSQKKSGPIKVEAKRRIALHRQSVGAMGGEWGHRKSSDMLCYRGIAPE